MATRLLVVLLLAGYGFHATAESPLRSLRDEKPSGDSKLETKTWKVGDEERSSLVHLPTKKEGKHPIVFFFHGHGGRSNFGARKFAAHELWPEAIVLYPQGLPTAVPVIDEKGRFPGWQKSVGDMKDRDLHFFDAMLKSMVDDHNGDPKQVYVTGHSNGGFFSYVLAAGRGDKIRAIAPIAAGINPRDLKDFKPMPVLHVAGENDPIVRFSVQEKTIDAIKKRNNCEEKGKEAKGLTTFPSSSGTPVVTFIHPGRHEIPEGAPGKIIDFFKEHSPK